MYAALRNGIRNVADRFLTEWPTSAAIYLPDGRLRRRRRADPQSRLGAHPEGRHRRQPARGGPAAARRRSRPPSTTSTAARSPSRRSKFSSSNAFLDDSRRGAHRAAVARRLRRRTARTAPRSRTRCASTYRGVEVLKCGPWSQGPVLLQQLKLLEGYDLRGARPQHRRLPAHLSRVRQARLRRSRALLRRSGVHHRADGLLLSDDYAAERRELIDARHASLELRPGSVAVAAAGGPRALAGRHRRHDPRRRRRPLGQSVRGHAQRRLDRLVAGRRGPRLPARHARPDVLPRRAACQLAGAAASGRARRSSPSLALRDGQPLAGVRHAGGDQQDQWSLQFFLNVVDFGMDLQEALDAPTVQSTHFPGSFYPHAADPGGVRDWSRASPPTSATSSPPAATTSASTARGATAR